MIDKIIESLESMAEDMRAMGDVEEASGVDSALWLIEEMTKKADTPQTDRPCDKCKWHKKYGHCIFEYCHYEYEQAHKDTPQTNCEKCAEYGSFKCTKCDGEMYYKPQTDCGWGEPNE